MTNGTLITVAPTGAESSKTDVPALPVTLDELVATARECEAVGASVIHVHIRDDAARPTLDQGRLKDTVQALRSETDLVVQLSSGGAVTDPEAARLAVLDAEPEMASCTMGTVNFGDDVFMNRWDFIVDLHTRMQDRGIVPEYEIFDLGHLTSLQRLLNKHGLPAGGHVHVDFVMNVPGGMPGTTEALVACKQALRDLPEGTTFAATGIGRSTIDVMLASLSTGGHLRVGMEDTTTYAKGQPVDSNMQLVARAVGFARLAQRPPLTTGEARVMLGVVKPYIRTVGYGRGVMYVGGELLAEVQRSGFAEGFHRGSVAVLGPDGALVASVGDPIGPVFPRSSNKPMQAVGMLRAGLTLADPADLALVAGSHFGEPMHIARVRSMLAGAGLGESDLRTPADLPLGEAAREALLRTGGVAAPIYMNCSGKHTGMLLTSQAAGWTLDDYRAADHPLQKQLRGVVEEICGESAAAVGVDGCGAPVLALSLTALASAFLRLVHAPQGSDERQVADAMRDYPELVSGTDADDERLMHGMPGLLSKGGAEGVFAAAVPGVGAVALKVDDGGMRARVPVLVAALRFLGCDAAALDALAEFPLLGGGVPVGAVRAVPGLFAP